MGVNKVNYYTPEGEVVLIDLTNDSVTKETLAVGETAHGKDGELIVGEMTCDPNADTVDGLHFQVLEEPTDNDDKTYITFVLAEE